MDSSIYMYVTNKDSSLYFPQNDASIFRVKLKNTLILKGSWKIGLCTIDMTNVDVKGNNSAGARGLFITCNVCTGLIVDGVQTRVLRCVQLEPDIHDTYSAIFYVPVEVGFLDTIEFGVITDVSKPALFGVKSTDDSAVIAGTLSMTLHLKRY